MNALAKHYVSLKAGGALLLLTVAAGSICAIRLLCRIKIISGAQTHGKLNFLATVSIGRRRLQGANSVQQVYSRKLALA